MTFLEVILFAIVALAAGYVAVAWLFKKDTAVEERRRGAARLAASLSGLGLKKTPEFLIDYSVGDYSGMSHKIKELAETFVGGEAGVLVEFEKVFDNLLTASLRSESGRALIAAKLSDAVRERDASIVTDAPRAMAK